MKRADYSWILFIMLSLCLLPSAWAQDEHANTPVGPYPSLYDEGKQEQPQPKTMVPDERPLSGAQALGLGFWEGGYNFLVPSLRFTQSVDSNPGLGPGQSTNFGSVSIISGGLSLERKSSRSDLTARYNGAGTFYVGDSNAIGSSRLNATSHEFGVNQALGFGRWTILVADEFTYTPEAVFGYAGAGGGGIGFGNDLAGLQNAWLPNQTILTQRSSRLSNTVLGQVQYSLSRWSSITVTGAYGFLHFPDGTLMDSNQMNFGVGYNRTLTRRDSIAVAYNYARFHFDGTNSNLQSHSAQLIYGRRVTGRLSLQVSGGGQWYGYDTAGSSTRMNWTAGTSATYRLRRTDLGLNYTRSVTGGAGVLAGSRSDTVYASLGRPLTRKWNASFNAGYSHNKGLRTRQSFDSQYAGVTLDRRLSRNINMYLSYNLQRQTGGVPCPGCSDHLIRHLFGFGFDWNFRPIRID